jgi:hypothetical protein
MSDGAYVLANDAFVNWLGYPREESHWAHFSRFRDVGKPG